MNAKVASMVVNRVALTWRDPTSVTANKTTTLVKIKEAVMKLLMNGLLVDSLAIATSTYRVPIVLVASQEVANADPSIRIDAFNADTETIARNP